MAEQQNMSIVVNPGEQMVRYMEISNGFMQGLTRQYDTNDVVSSIPVFSEVSAQDFEKLMRCPDWTYVNQQDEHCILSKLIMIVMCVIASHYIMDSKRENDNGPNVLESRNLLCEQFTNYTYDEIAQHKLIEVVIGHADNMRKTKYPPDSN